MKRVFLVMFFLAGCTVGPDYQTPAMPDGAAAPLAAFDPKIASTAEAPDAWWRLYQDPLLDHLVEEALRANTNLRAAEANLGAARAVLDVARATQYPGTKIDVGATYGRDPVTNEILEIAGHKPESDWILETVFETAYEIDLFGRVRRSIEVGEANRDAAIALRDSVKVTVVAETARSYAQICALGEEIAVTKHSVEVISHQAGIIVERQKAGASTRFDVARAEALVAQIRATLPALEGRRQTALYQLAALLGRMPADAPRETEACMAPPHLAALIPVSDGAALLRRRPDIRSAERRLATATAEIGVATADLYPRISLTGFFGGVSDKVELLTTNSGLAWGIGPSIAWSFPNQAAPRARIRQAEAATQAALAHFDSAVLQALKETAQTLSGYSANLRRQQDLVDFQAKERLAFELATNRFGAGSVSHLDLLTTEQALVSADAAVAELDSAIVQDQIAIFKALGGGWKN